jgi:hypothetical protein
MKTIARRLLLLEARVPASAPLPDFDRKNSAAALLSILLDFDRSA